MTPVTKYWVCKLAPSLIVEAMECLGGNGYVEEFPLARAYREAPVNAIWEGSGNVMALDVLRVLSREPETAKLVLADIAAAAPGVRALGDAVRRIEVMLAQPRELEFSARAVCEAFAVTAAGALLHAYAPSAVADAFLATRLSGGHRSTYGQGIAQANVRAILGRTAGEAI